MRELPPWIGDGATISDLAYDLVVVIVGQGRMDNTSLAKVLAVDEADLLRALAELQAAGVLEKSSA